jgi:hypothetical protein
MATIYNFTVLSVPLNTCRLDSIASNPPSGIVTINTYSGYNVIEFSANLYNGQTGITTITANNLVTIGTSALQGCTGLQTINFPVATSIATSAFQGCTSLNSVTLSALVTLTGSNVFDGCSVLATISLPALTEIQGNSVFNNCTGLTTVTVSSLNSITGNSTFNGCTSLASISLSSLATFTGTNTFYGCQNLNSITIPSAITSIPAYTFYQTEFTTFTNSNITSIGINAFENCFSLTSVTFANLTILGTAAFSGCANLVWNSINLGKITSIPPQSFKDCSFSLTTINLSQISINPITSVDNAAFQNCLFSSILAVNVSAIVADAFNGCSNLNSALFGGVSILNDRVFKGTAFTSINLRTLFTEDVVSLGQSVFEGCTQLVGFSGPNVESIDQNCFNGCSALNAIYIGAPINFNPNTNIFTGCSTLSRVCYNSAYAWSGTFAGITIAEYTLISTTSIVIGISIAGLTLNTTQSGGANPAPANITSINYQYQWYKDINIYGSSTTTYSPLSLPPGTTPGAYTLNIVNYFEDITTDICTTQNVVQGNRYIDVTAFLS